MTTASAGGAADTERRAPAPDRLRKATRMIVDTIANVFAPFEAQTPTTTAQVEHVGPEAARRWLDRNDRNRSLRRALVDRYARDMTRGAWELTGEAIKISTDGALLDGQHRLRAVELAGVTVPMLIVRGVADSAQSVMDTGAARQPGDALTLQGRRHGHALAAAARLGVLVEAGRIRTNHSSISHAELFAWIEANPEIVDAVERVTSGDIRNHVALSVSPLAYGYFRCSQANADATEEFFTALATRAELPLGSPVLTLATRLDRMARERRKLTRMAALWLVFRSWNAYRDGEPLTRLLLPTTIDSLPDPR